MRRRPGTGLLALLWAAAAVLPAVAGAADFRLIPSITQELRYNDNVFLSSSGAEHDTISYTLGGFRLLDKTERLDLNMSVLGAQSFYERNTRLNSTDLLTNGTARYVLTPKVALSTRGSYNRDSQPDRDLTTTGLVLTGARRERYTFGAGADYQFTEKTLASLNYDHETNHYESGASFSNFRSDSAGLSFQHDLTKLMPATTGLLSMGYSNYSLTGVDVDNYQATTGVRHAFHEKWSVQVAAGLRYSESTLTVPVRTGQYYFDPFPFLYERIVEQKTHESGWGGVGQASLDFTGEKTNASLTAARDIAAASGQNGTVERTSFTLYGAQRITYEFQGTLSASYFINKSTSGLSVNPINFATFNIAPGVRYAFNKDMYLEGSYTFSRVEDKQADTTATRNLFLLRFFAQHAVFE